MQNSLKKLVTQLSLGFVLFIQFTLNTQADTVMQPINKLNIQAEAHYASGEANKPAILILHGFLTTNKFHTIVSMANALHNEGYSVLSPTLTLNIDNRKNSVKCNTVHTHTLENDIKEIHHWVNWLEKKGHKKIILVGHSNGSLELLEYLKQYSNPHIQKAIFTSIFYMAGEELGLKTSEIEFAKSLINQPNMQLHKFSFLFCKNNYLATPKSYLSYLKLTRAYVLDALKTLKIPHYSIMGGADKRYLAVGKKWIDDLKKTGTNLVTIDGANHFFSNEHEFDLQDKIISIVNDVH